jgi:hypothetical protein
VELESRPSVTHNRRGSTGRVDRRLASAEICTDATCFSDSVGDRTVYREDMMHFRIVWVEALACC